MSPGDGGGAVHVVAARFRFPTATFAAARAPVEAGFRPWEGALPGCLGEGFVHAGTAGDPTVAAAMRLFQDPEAERALVQHVGQLPGMRPDRWPHPNRDRLRRRGEPPPRAGSSLTDTPSKRGRRECCRRVSGASAQSICDLRWHSPGQHSPVGHGRGVSRPLRRPGGTLVPRRARRRATPRVKEVPREHRGEQAHRAPVPGRVLAGRAAGGRR